MRDEPTSRNWPIRVLRVLGISALVAGGLTVALWLVALALLLAPLAFWLAWNALDFGPAIGLPELGFWATILATAFLVFGWFGKMVITAVVFLVEPAWFAATASVHWPEPTLRNFLAVALLAALAGHHKVEHRAGRKAKGRREDRAGDGRARVVTHA
ncbi:MAG: hypothetical protein OEY23_08685 [Acidimicrobiia bacterium]|nr:hypothetical protein [Acidimicrobiia bacterium]